MHVAFYVSKIILLTSDRDMRKARICLDSRLTTGGGLDAIPTLSSIIGHSYQIVGTRDLYGLEISIVLPVRQPVSTLPHGIASVLRHYSRVSDQCRRLHRSLW